MVSKSIHEAVRHHILLFSRAAQDRREMLQEIMRRGTNSLGTDVPSEREINRLAARTEEEFWLFEKMDEERRQRERYRTMCVDNGWYITTRWMGQSLEELLTVRRMMGIRQGSVYQGIQLHTFGER